MKKIAALCLAGAMMTMTAQAAPFSAQRLGWNKPLKPFHLAGNIYYVGMAGVSVFLIVTPQGDILTDGCLPESASAIEDHIKALGFKLSDVKILLNSHAHFDHAGGLAALKKATGAKLYASAADTPLLESGHITFGPSAGIDYPPVHVDHVVADGETVSLGGTMLTAHFTPGHTPGATTWTTEIRDHGQRHSVMFFSSITVAGNPLTNNTAYPQIAEDYRASFAKLDNMQADIFLAPHAEQFDLTGKMARRKSGAANPFIDPTELHRFVAAMKKDYDSALAQQMESRPKLPPH